MIFKFALAPRGSAGLFPHMAMAVALAGGAVAGTAAFAPAVYAQDYSKGFVAAYEPVAEIVGGETPDWEAAKAQFDSVANAVDTDDDRNAAGNLALQIGNGLNDGQFQRRGLELMLASGKVPEAQIGQFQFFVGNLAFNAEDYPEARAALTAAMAAGYTDNDPRGLILESYFQEDRVPEGVAYLLEQAGELRAAGQTIPESWLLRGLGQAYQASLTGETYELSKLIVLNDPVQKNWVNALQVVADISDLDTEAALDLYRLMRQTDALTQRAEYIRYIEAADPRIASNEVLPLLAAGLAADIFTSDETYYTEVLSIAEQRAPEDRAELEDLVADGRTGGGTLALNTGDLLWSMEDYARAEELYQLALDEGAERNVALTRLGMAQAMQGKSAEAVETLGQVTGPRQRVAEMWSIFAQTEMGA